MVTWIVLFAVSLVAMEGVAFVVHKYLMHGPMWFLHKSHHVRHDGWFELNDLFAVVFATPAIILIYFGTHGYPLLLPVGVGVTAYGAIYFGFHDVIVHRRLPLRFRPQSRYLKRIIKAHHVHHATRGKEGAVSFGFIYAPPIDKLVAQRN